MYTETKLIARFYTKQYKLWNKRTLFLTSRGGSFWLFSYSNEELIHTGNPIVPQISHPPNFYLLQKPETLLFRPETEPIIVAGLCKIFTSAISLFVG
jgi:hypothetical protein